MTWSAQSWRQLPVAQEVKYADATALAAASDELRRLPPLVTPWEIDRLKQLLVEASEGRRFLLQGGDCAETLADCQPQILTNKLKILLQMSLVLVHGGRRPVIRIGRFAGQYAKPRSSPNEVRTDENGRRVELPSYFGDLVNHPEFTAAARQPDPKLLVRGYQQAAATLNFVRSLSASGFADLHHPENWDLDFFNHATLSPELREAYQRTITAVEDALYFMEALGDANLSDLARVEFFTSHEGLHLEYESALTQGRYDLSAHLPWIGERTRHLNGAHVEFFSGIANPVGVKLGPSADPAEVVALCQRLNPDNAGGKVVLIPRLGASKVATILPLLIEAVRQAKQKVVWISDPMHGNTDTTADGRKTRRFDRILDEIEASFEVHRRLGSVFAGIHFELTGDDVTECVGAGTSEADLGRNYTTACDPRLNYRQALEMAFRMADGMSRRR